MRRSSADDHVYSASSQPHSADCRICCLAPRPASAPRLANVVVRLLLGRRQAELHAAIIVGFLVAGMSSSASAIFFAPLIEDVQRIAHDGVAVHFLMMTIAEDQLSRIAGLVVRQRPWRACGIRLAARGGASVTYGFAGGCSSHDVQRRIVRSHAADPSTRSGPPAPT